MIREILTVQVRVFIGFRVVNEEEGTIGGGGERDKVMGVTFFERWVMDKWSWERESSGDWW
jgi:hypothetical protein